MSENKNFEEKDEKEVVKHDEKVEENSNFPSELVNFVPLKTDSIFAGTGTD